MRPVRRWSCRCYFCESARWDALWEQHKGTDAYEAAMAAQGRRLNRDCFFGLGDPDGDYIRGIAESSVRFDYFRNLGRWIGRKAPLRGNNGRVVLVS